MSEDSTMKFLWKCCVNGFKEGWRQYWLPVTWLVKKIKSMRKKQSVVSDGILSLRVCEIYSNYRIAYAVDESGHRFMINEGSEGLDTTGLTVNQMILAYVTERNYVQCIVSSSVEKETEHTTND